MLGSEKIHEPNLSTDTNEGVVRERLNGFYGITVQRASKARHILKPYEARLHVIENL